MPGKMPGKQSGYSLIDVLVAISVFAIMMAAISGVITSTFRNSAQSDARTQKAVEVQQVAENLRRQWLDPTVDASAGTVGKYRRDRACYASGFSVPSGYTVTVSDVSVNQDGSFTVGTGYNLSANCAAATMRPAGTVRRVRVQSDALRGESAELTFEMY